MSSYRAFPICEVWQPEDFGPEDDSSETIPEFLIEIYASFTGEGSSFPHYYRFKRQRHLLTESRQSGLIICNMLSEISVPYHVQPVLIQTIATRAREIAGEPENANRKTIPILVYLTVFQEEFLEGMDQDEVFDHVLQPVRTKKSAIEKLESVQIEGCAKNCVICLEEMPNGSVATQMPCLHVYHGSCIVGWLEKSNLCPLCRCKMPVES